MSFPAVRRAAPAAVAVTMTLAAFALAVRATVGLEWPCEIDFFRDLGAAQTWLDGRAGTDPAYLGEVNWYNPLQPAIFAGLATVTGLPLPRLYAQAGPYLNLLGPFAFYLWPVNSSDVGRQWLPWAHTCSSATRPFRLGIRPPTHRGPGR